MNINVNIQAIVANLNLSTAENKTSTAIERLSSGYKINSAKDDPVGRALSYKLKTQIKGLERASQNSADGISVVQTAEGALTEVHSILQRMRELAVQGANGTSSDTDRQAIDSEIEALKDEINRISEDTQFNNTRLLDGSVQRESYTNVNGVEASYISSTVDSQTYGVTVSANAEKATFSSGTATVSVITEEMAGKFTINNEILDISAGTSITDVYSQISTVAGKLGIQMTSSTPTYMQGSIMKLTTDEYGTNASIEISCNDELAQALGLSTINDVKVTGEDAQVQFTLEGGKRVGFSESAILRVDGNTVNVQDRNLFELELELEPELVTTTPVKVEENVLDMGTMTIQVGNRAGQSIEININQVDTESLGIDRINCLTQTTCGKTVTAIDKAIQRLSQERSDLGAYQNRMEYASDIVDISSENIVTSLSRIEDTDMAAEMTEYTTQNVIQQAAIAMVAQANQQPEKILQLLQF